MCNCKKCKNKIKQNFINRPVGTEVIDTPLNISNINNSGPTGYTMQSNYKAFNDIPFTLMRDDGNPAVYGTDYFAVPNSTPGNPDCIYIINPEYKYKITFNTNVTVSYSIAGAGGGGGIGLVVNTSTVKNFGGGGGGGGQFLEGTFKASYLSEYNISIGRGGAGSTQTNGSIPALSGESSSIIGNSVNIIALGGGGGGNGNFNNAGYAGYGGSDINSGSVGGSYNSCTPTAGTGFTITKSITPVNVCGGGGGGGGAQYLDLNTGVSYVGSNGGIGGGGGGGGGLFTYVGNNSDTAEGGFGNLCYNGEDNGTYKSQDGLSSFGSNINGTKGSNIGKGGNGMFGGGGGGSGGASTFGDGANNFPIFYPLTGGNGGNGLVMITYTIDPGPTGPTGPTGPANWTIVNNILQPTNTDNYVQVGPKGINSLGYTPKLHVYDPNIPLIITKIHYLNYNPYNFSATLTNNLYYNWTTSVIGGYSFIYKNPVSVTMYYFIVGGGGNGSIATNGYGGGGGSGGQYILGSILLTGETVITINVGGPASDSSIIVNGITYKALGGISAPNYVGGANVGGGVGGNGGTFNNSDATTGGDTSNITFADGLTNNNIYVSGGGGGGGSSINNIPSGGANGGGGGGGGCGTVRNSTVPVTTGGIGINGNNGDIGFNQRIDPGKGTVYYIPYGGNGGAGKNFSSLVKGGVGGGGGGGGQGEFTSGIGGNIGKGGRGGTGAVMLYFLNTSGPDNSTLYVDGNASVSGTFTTSICQASTYITLSDYRIKQNVTSLDTETISNIANLRPVLYKNIITNTQDMGFIAHELQEYYPSLVTGEKDSTEYQTLNYIGLIPILVKAFQEQNKKIQDLEKKLEDLENK